MAALPAPQRPAIPRSSMLIVLGPRQRARLHPAVPPILATFLCALQPSRQRALISAVPSDNNCALTAGRAVGPTAAAAVPCRLLEAEAVGEALMRPGFRTLGRGGSCHLPAASPRRTPNPGEGLQRRPPPHCTSPQSCFPCSGSQRSAGQAARGPAGEGSGAALRRAPAGGTGPPVLKTGRAQAVSKPSHSSSNTKLNTLKPAKPLPAPTPLPPCVASPCASPPRSSSAPLWQAQQPCHPRASSAGVRCSSRGGGSRQAPCRPELAAREQIHGRWTSCVLPASGPGRSPCDPCCRRLPPAEQARAPPVAGARGARTHLWGARAVHEL